MEISELKAAIEALLFASDKPMTLAQLAATMDGAERKAVHQVLDELRGDYDDQKRGFRLTEIAEGWQLVSRPQHVYQVNLWVQPALLRQCGQHRRLSIAHYVTLALRLSLPPLWWPLYHSDVSLVGCPCLGCSVPF